MTLGRDAVLVLGALRSVVRGPSTFGSCCSWLQEHFQDAAVLPLPSPEQRVRFKGGNPKA